MLDSPFTCCLGRTGFGSHPQCVGALEVCLSSFTTPLSSDKYDCHTDVVLVVGVGKNPRRRQKRRKTIASLLYATLDMAVSTFCELPGQMGRLAEHLFRGRRLFLLTPPSPLPHWDLVEHPKGGSRCIAFFLPLNHVEEWTRKEKETRKEAIVQLFPLHPTSPDRSHSPSCTVTGPLRFEVICRSESSRSRTFLIAAKTDSTRAKATAVPVLHRDVTSRQLGRPNRFSLLYLSINPDLGTT